MALLLCLCPKKWVCHHQGQSGILQKWITGNVANNVNQGKPGF